MIFDTWLPTAKRLFQPVTGFVRTTGCVVVRDVPMLLGEPRGEECSSKPFSRATAGRRDWENVAVRVSRNLR